MYHFYRSKERYSYSLKRDRSLQDIDKDIETIWRELKELENMNFSFGSEKQKASEPLPELVTPSWKTGSTPTTQRRWGSLGSTPDNQRKFSGSQSSTNEQCSTPITTSVGPTHYSFLPRSSETKPGSIAPTYTSNSLRRPRSSVRTIPIVRQSHSTESDRKVSNTGENIKAEFISENKPFSSGSPRKSSFTSESIKSEFTAENTPFLSGTQRETSFTSESIKSESTGEQKIISSSTIERKEAKEEPITQRAFSRLTPSPKVSNKRDESTQPGFIKPPQQPVTSSSSTLKSCLKTDSRSSSLSRQSRESSFHERSRESPSRSVNFKAEGLSSYF